MKILYVNKFLYRRGGAETYMLDLAEEMIRRGHEVEFFGMDDVRNEVGNSLGLAVKNMDFHSKSPSTLAYPFKIIYSIEAKQKIGRVLDDFNPDVVHLNNINFQLTPSILDAIHARGIPMVMTVHDFQMVCPNHLLYIPSENRICTTCVNHPSIGCIANRCIHGSGAKSIIGYIEACLYSHRKNYDYIDRLICPSIFMKQTLDSVPRFADKTLFLRNYTREFSDVTVDKEDYIIYFGRLFEEKGLRNLAEATRQLPYYRFVIAGMGPLEHLFDGMPNVSFVGFQTGIELEMLIRKAKMSIYPSVWYENCPLSIIESQMLGTPCTATGIGGMLELVGERYCIPKPTASSIVSTITKLMEDEEFFSEFKSDSDGRGYTNLQAYADSVTEIYRSVVQSAPASEPCR